MEYSTKHWFVQTVALDNITVSIQFVHFIGNSPIRHHITYSPYKTLWALALQNLFASLALTMALACSAVSTLRLMRPPFAPMLARYWRASGGGLTALLDR